MQQALGPRQWCIEICRLDTKKFFPDEDFDEEEALKRLSDFTLQDVDQTAMSTAP